MVGKIEPRYGAEVYISGGGNICIKQEQGDHEDQILMFSGQEVDDLIELLKQAKQELAEGHWISEENESD